MPCKQVVFEGENGFAQIIGLPARGVGRVMKNFHARPSTPSKAN